MIWVCPYVCMYVSNQLVEFSRLPTSRVAIKIWRATSTVTTVLFIEAIHYDGFDAGKNDKPYLIKTLVVLI